MSAYLLGMAFKARMGTHSRKLVLLKLVDCARDDGRYVFPSNETISRDTEISVRQVQRTTKEFVKAGVLVLVTEADRTTKLRTNEYAINLDLLARLARDGWDGVFGALDDTENQSVEGDMVSPLDPVEKPVDNASEGDMVSPEGDTVPPNPLEEPLDTPHTPHDRILGGNPEPVAGGEVAKGRFEAFRDGYPRPDAGKWMVWGDIERNVWPFLDDTARQQAVDCLPTYRKAMQAKPASGRSTRLCNPKKFLKERRFVDHYAEATRRKDLDQTFVGKDEPIWPILDKRYTANGHPRGAPTMAHGGGGWYFPNGWIMQAKRELANGPPDTGRDTGAGDRPDADYAPGFDPP